MYAVAISSSFNHLLPYQRQFDGIDRHGGCTASCFSWPYHCRYPYFGYARQDRRVRSARVPITAKVVADFLSSVGVDRVLTR